LHQVDNLFELNVKLQCQKVNGVQAVTGGVKTIKTRPTKYRNETAFSLVHI